MPSKKKCTSGRTQPSVVSEDDHASMKVSDCDESEIDALSSRLDSLIVGKSADLETEQQLLAELETIVDNLSDKRSKLRTQGLCQLPVLLHKCCNRQYLLSNQAETIFHSQCQLFKRGISIADKILACKSLSVYAVIVSGGDLLDHESTFTQICELCFNSILNDSESANLRAAYVNLIAVCQLVGLGDDCPHLKREFIEILEGLFLQQRLGGDMEYLQTTAIFNWSALLELGLVDDHSFYVKSIERFLSKAESLLQCSCFEIRISTGQAVALVSELLTSDEKIPFVVSRELKNAVAELAAESSKRVGKKSLLAQHSHFREIEKSLKHGFHEPEYIQLGQETLTIDSWQLRYRYDLLSKVLNPKLHDHIKANLVLRQLLHLPDIWAENVGSANSRSFKKQIDKERKQFRRMMRDAKINGALDLYE